MLQVADSYHDPKKHMCRALQSYRGMSLIYSLAPGLLLNMEQTLLDIKNAMSCSVVRLRAFACWVDKTYCHGNILDEVLLKLWAFLADYTNRNRAYGGVYNRRNGKPRCAAEKRRSIPYWQTKDDRQSYFGILECFTLVFSNSRYAYRTVLQDTPIYSKGRYFQC